MTPLRGVRQRALPSGLPPLAGEASYADCGRALPCTRPYAGCIRGLCPLNSRPSPGRRPTRTAAGLRPAPAPARGAPKGSALWTPAPRRGGVLRGLRQGSALHPPLCGVHQRALPSELPPLAGEASYADCGRTPPCTRPYAGCIRGLCPLNSRWGLHPSPQDANASPFRLRAGRRILVHSLLFIRC